MRSKVSGSGGGVGVLGAGLLLLERLAPPLREGLLERRRLRAANAWLERPGAERPFRLGARSPIVVLFLILIALPFLYPRIATCPATITGPSGF